MTAPLYIYCSLYRCANRDRQAEANQGFLESFGNTVNAGFECVIKSTLLTGLDILASITCLILGILGACSVIGMSAAAAYALIGINCAITLLWLPIVGGIFYCCIEDGQQTTAGHLQFPDDQPVVTARGLQV